MSITNSCMQSEYFAKPVGGEFGNAPIPSLEDRELHARDIQFKGTPSALTGSFSPSLWAVVEHLDGGITRKILMGPLKGAGKGHHGRRRLWGQTR